METGGARGPVAYGRAKRLAGLAFAALGFVLTHVLFAAFILFLLGWLPWPSVNGTPLLPVESAIVIDIALVAIFGFQHSGMARDAVKRASARRIPSPLLERAVYVHAANVALALLIFLWQPVPVVVWTVEAEWARLAILAVFFGGWALASVGSLLIDHLHLLGMRQAWAWYKGEDYVRRPFQRRRLYDHVRHPIQLGLILAFWATPDMSVGHLILAVGLTAYILVGTRYEERDLVAAFGDDYRDYRARVPGFIPRIRRKRER